jgi:hypothetical protein
VATKMVVSDARESTECFTSSIFVMVLFFLLPDVHPMKPKKSSGNK